MTAGFWQLDLGRLVSCECSEARPPPFIPERHQLCIAAVTSLPPQLFGGQTSDTSPLARGDAAGRLILTRPAGHLRPRRGSVARPSLVVQSRSRQCSSTTDNVKAVWNAISKRRIQSQKTSPPHHTVSPRVSHPISREVSDAEHHHLLQGCLTGHSFQSVTCPSCWMRAIRLSMSPGEAKTGMTLMAMSS